MVYVYGMFIKYAVLPQIMAPDIYIRISSNLSA